MSNKGIFCLEGLWESDLRSPSSIQPLLAFLKQNEQISFIYGVCKTPEELLFYLSKFTKKIYKNYPILYLAFHGESGSLVLGGGRKYSLEKMGELLKGKCKKKIILFGSCSFLGASEKAIAEFLNDTEALAVLGYTNDVDWMRSSAFEMLLLSELQENEFDGRGIKAIEKKLSHLAEAFRSNDRDKNINFRIEIRKSTAPRSK
jgi:hypothetical protein